VWRNLKVKKKSHEDKRAQPENVKRCKGSMKHRTGSTTECNLHRSDQIVYQVSSQNGYVAAIGTSRPPFGPTRHGQAALYPLQKHLLPWVFIHNFSHCGLLETDSRSVSVNYTWCYVHITSPLTSLPVHISARTDHYSSCCRLFVHSFEWLKGNTKFESLKTSDLNTGVLNCDIVQSGRWL